MADTKAFIVIHMKENKKGKVEEIFRKPRNIGGGGGV